MVSCLQSKGSVLKLNRIKQSSYYCCTLKSNHFVKDDRKSFDPSTIISRLPQHRWITVDWLVHFPFPAGHAWTHTNTPTHTPRNVGRPLQTPEHTKTAHRKMIAGSELHTTCPTKSRLPHLDKREGCLPSRHFKTNPFAHSKEPQHHNRNQIKS